MEKIKQLIKENRSLINFLGWAFLLLILWVLFTSFFHRQLMALHYSVIVPQTKISGWLLDLMGYGIDLQFFQSRFIGEIKLDSQASIRIGSGCSGLELFLIFAGFIVIFKGNVKHKIWFVPFGLLFILALNILRISGLSLILYHAPEYMQFNHKYTFVIIVYGAIFLLWLWWVNRFSKNKSE